LSSASAVSFSSDLGGVLSELETKLAHGERYVLGAGFSVADCAIAPFLLRLEMTYTLSSKHWPRIAEYVRNLRARHSVKATTTSSWWWWW